MSTCLSSGQWFAGLESGWLNTVEKLAVSKKVIWITGASSGIGNSLAKSYLEQGHYLIVSGRNQQALKNLESVAPDRVSILDFDLTDSAGIGQLPQRFAEIIDYLDLVILAAGACEYVDRPSCGEALYRRIMETNYFSQIGCFLVALPLLRRSEKPGQVVGIGSLAAHLPFPRAQAYGASKAAFEYWMDCMRIDLKPECIDVTLVSPGFVDTPLTRKNDFVMPTLMTLERATKVILDGIEKKKRHVRFPWTLKLSLAFLSVFGGLWYGVIAPRLTRKPF